MRTNRTSQTVSQLTFHCTPCIAPSGWIAIAPPHEGSSGCSHFVNSRSHLLVVLSAAKEADGREWLHVSVSHRDRIPNWEELLLVKELFVGEDRQAVQVFPPKIEYVNYCKRALHLWSCLSERVIPDFRHDGMI